MVFPAVIERKEVLSRRIAEAEQQVEQYKHNPLLHKLHTIHVDYLSQLLKHKLLYHNDRSAFMRRVRAEHKHLNSLTKSDDEERTHN